MGLDKATRYRGTIFPSKEDDYIVPQYRQPGWAPEPRLTVTDSHRALVDATERARKLELKIARKKQSFFRRHFTRKINLQGEAKKLDKTLDSMDEIDLHLTIYPLLSCPPRLREVLKQPLLAEQEYEDALEALKTSLLRTEEQFNQTVLEPLRRNLTEKEALVFPELIQQVLNAKMKAWDACREYQETANALCDKITDKDFFAEAQALNATIDDLISQAKKKGWDREKDPDFKKLDESHVFDRADGPSSVIAYLERVSRRNELKSREHISHSGIV